jgi:MFS family permease
MLLAQNLILMGIFFTIPLYLQVVQGLDALETGLHMLPASAGLFLAAIAGSGLARRFSARRIVRAGLAVVLVAVFVMLGTIDVELDSSSFLVAMGVLGIGMGLVVSQLGNVVQSSVGDRDRSEAGGLQNTSMQLGSSLGTALLGAVVISGLLAAFSGKVQENPEIPASVKEQVSLELSSGGSFVVSDQVRDSAEDAGIDSTTTGILVTEYEDAQLQALKTALLVAALLVLASVPVTRNLPGYPLGQPRDGPGEAPSTA